MQFFFTTGMRSCNNSVILLLLVLFIFLFLALEQITVVQNEFFIDICVHTVKPGSPFVPVLPCDYKTQCSGVLNVVK